MDVQHSRRRQLDDQQDAVDETDQARLHADGDDRVGPELRDDLLQADQIGRRDVHRLAEPAYVTLQATFGVNRLQVGLRAVVKMQRELARALASMKAERRGGARNNTTAAPAAAPPTSAPNVGTGGKLPDELRRELPTLAFGGASYSKDPSSRMVIFNGRVFHEGDTIAPQLVLDQIRPKAAVFSYKGYHYEVDF